MAAGCDLTSADGTVLRPVPDSDDGVRECAGDGAALPRLPLAPRLLLALTRPSTGGFMAKLGPVSDAAKGFAGDDRTVPCMTRTARSLTAALY